MCVFYALYLEQVKQGKFKMSNIEIGNRIREIRNSLGLNQRDFAKILETSSGYISSIESGKNMAGGDFLLRLHDKFNTNLHYILTGNDSNMEQDLIQTETNLTKDEQELLDLYRQSNGLGQIVILSAARGAEKKENYAVLVSSSKINLGGVVIDLDEIKKESSELSELTMKEIMEKSMGKNPSK